MPQQQQQQQQQQPAHHQLTVILSIRNPTPFFIYVVYSGPLWPTFLPL